MKCFVRRGDRGRFVKATLVLDEEFRQAKIVTKSHFWVLWKYDVVTIDGDESLYVKGYADKGSNDYEHMGFEVKFCLKDKK